MFKYLKNHKKIVLFLLSIIGIFGWYYLSQKTAPTYTEYQVESKDIAETIELSGKITASRYANLRFPTGGLVTYLGAQKGDKVKKYQTIASLDTRQTQKILEQKLNLYAIQRNTFEQTIDDTNNSIPDGDLARELKRLLEKNQYQLENAVRDVEYQDLSVRLSRLTSPIAGILVSSPFSVSGVNATATDSWLVVDPTSLEFSADLDEIDLKKVSEGQKARIKIDAFPDLELNSTIRSISYSPKETTSGTTYEVKIPLPQDALSNFRLGQNGTAEIILEEKFAVPTLPIQAVTYKGGKVEVLLKSGNTYSPKSITVGTESTNYLEIKSGLSVGDKVYVKQTN